MRPFPSSLLPLFQNESTCETFHMKMSSTCSFIFMQIKFIFITMVSHLDSFWNRGTRELGNGLLSRRIWFNLSNSIIFLCPRAGMMLWGLVSFKFPGFASITVIYKRSSGGSFSRFTLHSWRSFLAANLAATVVPDSAHAVWINYFPRFSVQKWKLEISRQMKGIDYVTETNPYRAFSPFNTLVRKIVFCPERDSNPRLPDY